jgi:hypothetical protein
MTQREQNDVEVIDEAGTAAALTIARKALRDREQDCVVARKRVHEALHLRKMVSALDGQHIPNAHRPRLIREMTALGKGADFDGHVRDYKTAIIDTHSGDASCNRESQ